MKISLNFGSYPDPDSTYRHLWTLDLDQILLGGAMHSLNALVCCFAISLEEFG